MVSLEWLDVEDTWYLYDSSDGRVLGLLRQAGFTTNWAADELRVYSLSIPGSEFDEMYVGLKNAKLALLDEVRTRFSQWSILTGVGKAEA